MNSVITIGRVISDDMMISGKVVKKWRDQGLT